MIEVVAPYRERPARIPGADLWTREAEGGDYRILPDGCMDLLLMHDDLYVAGPDSHAWMGNAERGTRYAGIRFAPGAAPEFLGVPARDLLNQRVRLADLWSPTRSRKLRDRILTAEDRAEALDLGVATLVGDPSDGLVSQVLRSVRAGRLRKVAGVSRLAAALGLSERQLHRRCLDAFGYGPKLLDRVLWMNVALDQARTGLALADVAVRTGYADQAHFTRDVKALTGLPPRILLG
ncbi:helix-turn-helix transcriptional regulator [Kribbella sp. NPDC026611]|uniref:helix-turn-helix transcriptional regulator n=1 Tax=Kribbella sp. NPDC026611 TaxID=3154911 RepID=UPI0033D90D3E